MSVYEAYGWWAALKHGGLLIAPTKLADHFADTLPPLAPALVDRLRRDVTRRLEADTAHQRDDLSALLDTVLEAILGLDGASWRKGPQVGSEWSQQLITRDNLKPRRLWLGPHGALLPLFLDDSGTRLGIGRSRRTVSQVIEWLRRANQRVALLTNGHQWRLIHAGSDYDAWCEWDIDFWFEEGQPSQQVTALRLLLGVSALTPTAPDAPAPLLAAIQASRQGQAELSAVLGERVRQAVELLIKESAPAIATVSADPTAPAALPNNALYIAACRVIMRCVIILFAEARDLLRRDNAIYHGSYGIQGLREQLDHLAGGRAQERLRHSYSAWPRLLALFQLVYSGSAHKDLPIPAYRGELFAPGDSQAADPVRRATVAFETVEHCPSDAAIYRILELLTRSKVKVRQGKSSILVDAPVDFSDLSSEYIGILYQGLLDFELRQALGAEPMAFLNLGDQPVLPLTRLEAMDDGALAALVEKLKTSKAAAAAAGEGEEAGDSDSEDPEAVADEAAGEAVGEAVDETVDDTLVAPADDPFADDVSRQLRARAVTWARRAVIAGKLIKPPRSKDAAALAHHAAAVNQLAEQLIARVVLPGEWFLVRWGGTRKGAGTFYTRPQLGVPLVRRTLQPLAYVQSSAAPDRWYPQPPEVILALKVCDSAMGSGSLLAAALRYLTNALYESLLYHGRLAAHGDHTLVRLLDGGTTNSMLAETLPLPVDHPELEEYLKARLKRYVVERCLYGVDLDPLAVELAKLSLWIETMDRALPFGFLDHKLKCGNALVGCWFDRFQDYPVMAWEREGGDKNHDRFVHHYREFVTDRGKTQGQTQRSGDKWTQAIKELRNNLIKPQMVEWITAQHALPLAFAAEGYTTTALHEEALAVFADMAALPVHATEEKAHLYQEKIVANPAIAQFKLALDTWCAIWFWPGEQLDLAPTPKNFAQPPAATAAIVQELATRHRFLHWELEFPDVFATQHAGFDALLGNPPWDILKPKSQEFFSNIDPLYRTYGKQEANAHQLALFTQDAAIEHDWLAYSANFKALSNWTKHVGTPFGDDQMGGEKFTLSRIARESAVLHTTWRSRRRPQSGYTDAAHPFLHQGSADINTYKLFLELSHRPPAKPVA